MSMPFYVAPEQMMKDRAEFARKGIARGRALAAVEYADGVVFVGQNPARSLYKTSEIYDRIGFAAVGRYNEFESLRVSGIRLADVKGYQYARDDVSAKSLANAFSQALGGIFMGEHKPYEVELLIAQVNPVQGDAVNGPGGLELYHILFDGSMVDEHDYVAIGGEAEALRTTLSEGYEGGLDLGGAVRLAARALAQSGDGDTPADELEVSGLDRTRGRRQFFRVRGDQLRDILEAR